MYRIRDWQEHFENNRTRELKDLHWVPVPNKHDGDGFTALMDHPKGAEHYGVWALMVQVASKCDPRGTLVRDGPKGPIPHDAKSLARVSHIPVRIITAAIPRLLEVGWLEEVTTIPQEGATIPQEGATIPQEGAAFLNGMEGNGMEGNGMEEEGGAAPPATDAAPSPPAEIPEDLIMLAWRRRTSASGLPAVQDSTRWNESRLKKIRARWEEPDFRERYEDIFAALAGSRFCCGDNDRGWKASFDWIIENGENYVKVLEGKYHDSNHRPAQAGAGKPAQAAGNFGGAANPSGRSFIGGSKVSAFGPADSKPPTIQPPGPAGQVPPVDVGGLSRTG